METWRSFPSHLDSLIKQSPSSRTWSVLGGRRVTKGIKMRTPAIPRTATQLVKASLNLILVKPQKATDQLEFKMDLKKNHLTMKIEFEPLPLILKAVADPCAVLGDSILGSQPPRPPQPR